MTDDKYKDLRDALAAGPTPGQWLGRKDGKFTNMDGWSADHEDFTFCAAVPIKAGGEVIAIAVDGRDDLDLEMAELKANADYIAAANPETVRALLAERDALLTARDDFATAAAEAQAERDAAREERDRLREALRHLYHNARVSGAEMGLALDVAASALAQHQGEKHGDQ